MDEPIPTPEPDAPGERAGVWSVVANVRRAIPYGPGGAETKSGLRKFRAGAKVYVVGGYHGPAVHAMVIGRHRSNGEYIRCVVRARALERLRVSMIYSPAVIALLEERPNGLTLYLDREGAEDFVRTLGSWGAG